MTIAVCWKWVSIGDGPDRHRRTVGRGVAGRRGRARDSRSSCRRRMATVTVVCVGPAGADAALRGALAAGATRAGAHRRPARARQPRRRDRHSPAWSAASDFVICGDYSLDRGTGSVPGVPRPRTRRARRPSVSSRSTASRHGDTTLRVPPPARRRPPRGARRRPPAVISVEGSVRRLRRASLGRGRRLEGGADIEIVEAVADDHAPPPPSSSPYRPRARALPRPHGPVLDRVREHPRRRRYRHVPRRDGRARTRGGRAAHRRSTAALGLSRDEPATGHGGHGGLIMRLGDATWPRCRRGDACRTQPSTAC